MPIDPFFILAVILIQFFFIAISNFSLKKLSAVMEAESYNKNPLALLLSWFLLGNFALLFITGPVLIIALIKSFYLVLN